MKKIKIKIGDDKTNKKNWGIILIFFFFFLDFYFLGNLRAWGQASPKPQVAPYLITGNHNRIITPNYITA
jgi:hypothetical protein